MESYALGLATPFEVAEFEQLLPHFPELQEALSEFEYHLELFSIDNEVPPPPEVKERIKARIREVPAVPEKGQGGSGRRAGGNGGREKKGVEYIPVEVTTPYIRVHKRWRTFLS
ncbi:hypothetical protein ACQ86N_09325 [Puia sp. P3]|uniref:hypothetical protein n=1 Tax=Puia sp. P3 TaxID=3423952 RepID=UPI003D68003C